MKHKLYYILGMIGSICLSQQTGYAFQSKQEQTSAVDTLGQTQKVIIKVKDLASSKLLDSVHVTMGKESKFTNKGIVVFENNADSIIILTKPGYNRLGKKLSSTSQTVYMSRAEEVLESFANNTALIQDEKDLFSGSTLKVSGDQLRNVSTLSLLEGLKFYSPSLFVQSNNSAGGNPNVLPQVSLLGSSNFPFLGGVLNKNSRKGLQINPSAADYKAYHIAANGSPTVLLDGVQVSLQTIQDLDLNRIKNITVLKDAVSTSSFGMTGGNGVIAVETIRPQGRWNISFSEQVQLTTADLSSFKLLSAKEKLAIDQSSGLFDGILAPIYQSRYDRAYDQGINTNWLKIPLRNAIGSKHSLSLNTGNDEVVYGLTASYNDTEGSMKGSNRKILDLGAYFGGRIGALTFNNQFSYLNTNASNSSYGSFDTYMKMNAYWNPFDPYTGKFQKIVEQNTVGGENLSFKNPAFNSTLSTTDKSKYARFSNLTNLNWIIGSGFQLNGMFSIAQQNDENDYFLPPNHTEFADISVENLFKRGLYEYNSSSFTAVQAGGRLQYKNDFNKHHFFANVGQSITQTKSESEGIAVSGFAVDRLADISFGNAYSIAKPISGKINTRYASTFANFGYNYDRRYQLDVTGSLDYYSGLNTATAFGAFGAAWNINEERFFRDITWIDQLKVKGSIGVSGNQDFLSYLNRTTYNYFTDQQYVPSGSGLGTIGKGLGAYLTNYGNKNLKSPQTIKQNIGLDATLFKNRLALNVNVFKHVNRDMILPINAISTTGFQSFSHYENYGEIENTGVEMGVFIKAFESKPHNLKLDIIANAIHRSDKIKRTGSYLFELNDYHNITSDQYTPQPQSRIGYSPFAIWAVPSLGIDAQSGEELFLKKDGTSTTIWDANDKVFAGNLTANWVGTLGFDMTFRQFSLGSYFQLQHGAKVYNQTMSDIENAPIHDNLDGRVLYNGRWTTGKTDAAYKALYHSPTYVTTRLVESDNRIQCSTISFGYTFSQSLAEKLRTKHLGVKLMANNAFEIGGADMQRGLTYPYQRVYSFILNANF